MRGPLLVLAPVLHLTRITTAFAAVGNAWFVILWTRATEQEPGVPGSAVIEGPLWTVLVFGAVAAIGLFAFAIDTAAAFFNRPIGLFTFTIESTTATFFDGPIGLFSFSVSTTATLF